jgi:competence protein ComEC
VHTRFRAYQLGRAGSLFSYFAGGHFTLIEAIEAMATDLSKPRILAELASCGKKSVDTLHITSWDEDHCNESGLNWVLANLMPAKIEFLGYQPHTDCSDACLEAIRRYQSQWIAKGHKVGIQSIDPPYIATLPTVLGPGYRDMVYHPRQLRESSNNNSAIKFFRRGSFNVLSLGDVEDPSIAAMVRRCKTLRREIDILILAHHGADSGFTTKSFLDELKPKAAVCSSNFDNQYDHPRQEIRDLLFEQGIRLFTTKTGDAVVRSLGSHRVDYQVTNLICDSTKVSSVYDYKARKAHWLAMNADTLRNVLRPGFKGLK